MSVTTPSLAPARALSSVIPTPSRAAVAAAVFGAVVGLGVGSAYLGGTLARGATVRAQAERMQGAAQSGFTDEALAAAVGGLDESALAIARRHDPYTVAGAAARDRQAALLSARLEKSEPRTSGLAAMSSFSAGLGNGLRAASFAAGPVAPPFRMAGGAIEASRDLDCLTQAVYYEARGEGSAGMQAVAQVILNRVRHPAFPKSVCAVVFQGAGRRTGCQFSFTCDGSMRRRVGGAAWDRARQVATASLAGRTYAAVGTATHFHTTGVRPGWSNSLIRTAQVGAHLFYRFGGRSGGAASFQYAAQPSRAAPAQQPVYASLDAGAVAQAGGQAAYTILHGLAEQTGAAPAAPASPQPAPAIASPASPPVAAPAPASVTPTA
ncbi:MAG TPA: cell wall hydrolase [Caulobacteraceae bacterium]